MSFNRLLTLIFVWLKIFHVISWSWLWVLSPIWAPYVVILPMAFFYGFLSDMMKAMFDPNNLGEGP